MKFNNIAVISLVSTLMVACGSSSAPSAPDTIEQLTDEPSVTGEEALDPNAIYDTTAELVVANSFLLKPEFELTVNYKNEDSRRAYLSVCTDFNQGDDGIKVNYDSCLLRTSIDSDYAGTLVVGNDQNSLVMAVWYLDDLDNPKYEIWNNVSDSEGIRSFSVN